MRIAMLAPIAWRVPPRHYGPWERVVALLTDGLVARNIDVTLFATADSRTQARLAPICPRPYAEDSTLDAKAWECLHIAAAFERAAEFDLIHNHFDFLPLSYSMLVKTPLLTTIHGFSSPRILPVYQRYNQHCHYVAISNADRHPSLDYLATVYHGIALNEFTLRQEQGEYLLFFGRIHPEKGVADAITVAQRSGRRLIIAGIVQDQAFFEQQVAPHLDGDQVQYIGSVGPDVRDALLGKAFALLHLVQFEEPFGLSMVEAMACGTPVIAYRRGSVPEVVQHGESGWIVDDVDAAISAVGLVGRLNRAHIRAHVTAHFSQERMVDAYLQVYSTMLQSRHRSW
ncbi:MAG: glycosyltransferase family 4 protein [Chloroflexaceae bacterium]|jgi:glycosyltransferase involved in cell wall biosynthesis|nr:glycosyltransferase family 4 protein [Chloroflexaceae bacterium]